MIAQLIERLARLSGAASWTEALNPAQAAALGYLARANRYSRGPSMVAEYLGSTRGTVSQTLKALESKGLITAQASARDRRSISYALTESGQAALSAADALDKDVAALPAPERAALEAGLAALARAAIARRGGKSFGMCRSCRSHQRTADGARCAALGVALEAFEAEQICGEHGWPDGLS